MVDRRGRGPAAGGGVHRELRGGRRNRPVRAGARPADRALRAPVLPRLGPTRRHRHDPALLVHPAGGNDAFPWFRDSVPVASNPNQASTTRKPAPASCAAWAPPRHGRSSGLSCATCPDPIRTPQGGLPIQQPDQGGSALMRWGERSNTSLWWMVVFGEAMDVPRRSPGLLARVMNRISAVQFSAGLLSPKRAVTLEMPAAVPVRVGRRTPGPFEQGGHGAAGGTALRQEPLSPNFPRSIDQ